MNNWQKFGLVALIVATGAYIKLSFFTPSPTVEDLASPAQQEEEIKPQEKPKVYVNLFFVGQNTNKEEMYKAVKREYNADTDGSKLNFAVKNLVNGPTPWEKSKGIYSEIPSGTKLLSLEEQSDKVIINLNSAFGSGGGADGLYKRMFQLIKTANKNTNLPIYLYIDGKQADVIGGEGLMITQPLNESSLDG